MKKLLLVCLLGLATFIPNVQAKSSMSVMSRILDIHIEGWALSANSDDASGLIQQIQIYDINTGKLMISQNFKDYSAKVNISQLPAGNYVGVVICTNDVRKLQFNIGG